MENLRKKYSWIAVVLLLVISVTSCSVEDDSPSVRFEVVEVVSVDLPQQFTFGETHDIVIRYNKPSRCHVFSGFDVTARLNERTVTTVATIFENEDCTVLQNEVEEQVLKFRAASNGSYNFRFFTGLDQDNEPEYLEFEVFVQE